MAPKDENELQHMLKTAIDHPGPVALRYPRGNGVGVAMDEDLKTLPIGRGEILREGEDILLIAIGSTVRSAMAAAKRLEQEDIWVTVLNARFVKPLDEDLILEWTRKIGKIITIEENVLQGGFGSAVLEMFQEHSFFPKSFIRLGLPDSFIPHGSQAILRNLCGIDAEGIELAVHKLLQTGHGPLLRAIGQTAGR
jgi:1-deoxy-D-xylulose-5-phosphate synthase